MRTRTHLNRLRELIEKAVTSLSDTDALHSVELFKHWQPNTEYEQDDRFSHEGVLYKSRQLHTSSQLYPPGSVGTEALYEEVAEEDRGDSQSNPIPYNNNMELIEGKYYSQYDVVYICFRGSGQAVFNDLTDLIEIYVRVVT